MKKLNNKKMRKILRQAVKKVNRIPKEGTMINLLYGDLFKDKDHWQVELINDSRYNNKPYIAVYRWKRPKTMAAIPADYVLLGTLKGAIL